jgi:hypothetical protein
MPTLTWTDSLKAPYFGTLKQLLEIIVEVALKRLLGRYGLDGEVTAYRSGPCVASKMCRVDC